MMLRLDERRSIASVPKSGNHVEQNSKDPDGTQAIPMQAGENFWRENMCEGNRLV